MADIHSSIQELPIRVGEPVEIALAGASHYRP